MSLVTSVASLEELNKQKEKTTRTEESNGGVQFQAVFQSKVQSGSESMDAIFEEAAAKYNISVDLIKAVAKAESNFNPNAVSKSGAIGVMQLMPATARSLGVTDPYNARQNIMGGAKYLKENLDRFNGNVNLALAAYNAGPNSVQKYGGIPPYSETQNYVKVVNSYLGGTPLYSGKMVAVNQQANLASSLYGLSSGQLGVLGGSSSLGSGAYGINDNFLSSMYGTSYSQLAGLYGITAGQGGYGSSANTLGMLLGASATSSEDTVTMSKESYISLIEMLRLQMMMNASREVGAITL